MPDGSLAAHTGAQLERTQSVDSLEERWDELAQLSENIFATREWLETWWRHFGRGRERFSLVERDASGEISAIVPLCQDHIHGIRVIRFPGYGASDELGPICAPEHAPSAALALGAAMKRGTFDWDMFLGERLPGWCDWQGSFRGSKLHSEASPNIDLDGLAWDDYLADRSSNFRSQVRRKERILIREHRLSYRLSDDPHRLEADMATLLRLHAARWGSSRSDAFDSTRQAFHQEFAAIALERGWLRLWLAEAGGTAVAAWYGFRFGRTDFFYQFGRDPAWDRYSIGFVLLAHTVRDSTESGAKTYRLLRGAEAYKARFATSDPGIVTVASARGAAGKSAVVAVRAALSLPAPARRMLLGRFA